jgi:hypothetical protein
VAFERLLVDGHRIVARMTSRGPVEGGGPTLCHIATDGETYGHHHRYGDMALAWALTQVAKGWNHTRLTNYAAFRAAAPATWEVEIGEGTSWSCAHGVARWRDDCGCNSGGKPGWNQRWRRPLRDALDWLRDQAGAALEGVGRGLLRDPWAARDAYIGVVLERTPAARDRFLDAHAAHRLDPAERVRALSLMEMARHAMLMYTSCGWFFDDLSGIETVQCLQYAARVTELLEVIGGAPVEPAFVERLARARSNLAEEGGGDRVWAQRVRPARVDPEQVCAHVAVHTLVEQVPAPRPDVFGYHVDFLDRVERRSGRARMVVGQIRVCSQLTEATASVCFAGLHLGEQHVTGGLRQTPSAEEWSAIVDDLTRALATADVFAAQRRIEHHFPEAPLSLAALLPGTRERVLAGVLRDAIASAERELAHAYDEHVPLIRWLAAHKLPVPEVLHTTAKTTLRRRVLANLRADEPSFARLREHIAEAEQVRVSLDTPEIALAASDALHRMIDRVAVPDGPGGVPDRPGGELDAEALETVARASEVAVQMKSGVDLWFVQNATFQLLRRLPELRRRGGAGDAQAARLAEDLQQLAHALRIAVPR